MNNASAATPHEQLVEWLSSPAAYEGATCRDKDAKDPYEGATCRDQDAGNTVVSAVNCVERIETHISQVFLVGDRVYKLKKPVRFDFLDFESLAARESACREEVRLNRRLAPDVYLRVVPVTKRQGNFRIDGPGEIIDWLVEMKRLPGDAMLDTRLQRGTVSPTDMDRVADHLIAFYRGLTPMSITGDVYRARLLEHAQRNQETLLSLLPSSCSFAIRRAHGFQLRLLNLRCELFDHRVAEGRVVEGHGDLRPEHICLTDAIAIFDCIEFNAEFRTLDIADELAFLAAECDFLNAPWVGKQVWARYQAETGDRPPEELWAFYRCYRACVRAKVASLRSHQLDDEHKSSANEDTYRHLELADQYAAPYVRPLVIAVGGLSGTGKSTLARALAKATGADVVRTDEVRREVFAELPATATPEQRYSRGSRDLVYQEMMRRAAQHHSRNVSVVLDATFSQAKQIIAARSIATQPGTVFLAVECYCPAEVARTRIAKRLAVGEDASEALPELRDQQAASWENWPDGIVTIRVDTTRSIEDQVQVVLTRLRGLLEL